MSAQFLIKNHFTATTHKNLSDHKFILYDQDGVLVGHYVLSRENYLQPCLIEHNKSVHNKLCQKLHCH